MLRLLDRVALANVSTADPVQKHVHLADGPGATVEFLPGEFEISSETDEWDKWQGGELVPPI